jgi:TonB family protein
MHDAVADVLAQRATLSSGRTTAMLLSLALHGGITALAVWSALHAPPPQRVSTVDIRLASPQRTPQPLAPKAPAPPAPKPEPPRIEEPKPEPVKPATSTAPPVKNTAPTSSFGRSTKKPSDIQQPPAKPSPPPTTTTAPEIPIGGAGVTGFEGGEFPYPLYVEGMQRKIGAFWIRPKVAPGIATIVSFRIERDGTISEAKVTTSSGSSIFDRAALSAVRSSSPLNSLPFGYSGTYLGVQLTFR